MNLYFFYYLNYIYICILIHVGYFTNIISPSVEHNIMDSFKNPHDAYEILKS